MWSFWGTQCMTGWRSALIAAIAKWMNAESMACLFLTDTTQYTCMYSEYCDISPKHAIASHTLPHCKLFPFIQHASKLNALEMCSLGCHPDISRWIGLVLSLIFAMRNVWKKRHTEHGPTKSDENQLAVVRSKRTSWRRNIAKMSVASPDWEDTRLTQVVCLPHWRPTNCRKHHRSRPYCRCRCLDQIQWHSDGRSRGYSHSPWRKKVL